MGWRIEAGFLVVNNDLFLNLDGNYTGICDKYCAVYFWILVYVRDFT